MSLERSGACADPCPAHVTEAWNEPPLIRIASTDDDKASGEDQYRGPAPDASVRCQAMSDVAAVDCNLGDWPLAFINNVHASLLRGGGDRDVLNLDLINLRRPTGNGAETGSNTGTMHFASCIECMTCQNDGVARTPAESRIAKSDSPAAKPALGMVTSVNGRRFQQLPTSGAPMAGLDAPSIGRYCAYSRLRPLVMNVRF
jgi:hypothetical protein